MNINPKLKLEDLKRMYFEEGLSTNQIGKLLGAEHSSVRQALLRGGCTLRSSREAAYRRTDLTLQIDWNEVGQKYLAGKSTTELAKEYGCSICTVAIHLRGIGVPLRPQSIPKGSIVGPRKYHRFDVQEAIRLSKEGKTLLEIGKALNVDERVVGYNMRKSGYSAKANRPKIPKKLKGLTPTKREVLAALGYSSCLICGESRVIDLAHILPRKHGHELTAENAMVLCPNHHRLHHAEMLTSEEIEQFRANPLSPSDVPLSPYEEPESRLELN